MGEMVSVLEDEDDEPVDLACEAEEDDDELNAEAVHSWVADEDEDFSCPWASESLVEEEEDDEEAFFLHVPLARLEWWRFLFLCDDERATPDWKIGLAWRGVLWVSSSKKVSIFLSSRTDPRLRLSMSIEGMPPCLADTPDVIAVKAAATTARVAGVVKCMMIVWLCEVYFVGKLVVYIISVS